MGQGVDRVGGSYKYVPLQWCPNWWVATHQGNQERVIPL